MNYPLQIPYYDCIIWIISALKSSQDHHMIRKYGKPGMFLADSLLREVLRLCHIWDV